MIHRFTCWLLMTASAGLLFVSCATTDYAKQVENLAKISDGSKAYIVAKIDNQTGKDFLSTRGQPSIWLDRALTNATTGLEVKPRNDSSLVAYEVKPGSYRISDFIVFKGSLLGRDTLTTYELDPLFYTFFKVNPGEVVYFGTYTMVDKGDALTLAYDLDGVKDELVTKYPQLEGFRWVGFLEDRPSF